MLLTVTDADGHEAKAIIVFTVDDELTPEDVVESIGRRLDDQTFYVDTEMSTEAW